MTLKQQIDRVLMQLVEDVLLKKETPLPILLDTALNKIIELTTPKEPTPQQVNY